MNPGWNTPATRKWAFSKCWPPLALAVCLLLGEASHGADRALVVTGLSGSSANTEEFSRLALETQRLLVERGLSAANVEVLSDKVTREAILGKLREIGAACGADDEFWLVLFGHSGVARGGVPAFQVSGPRLTAEDLQTALAAIPARQFVFIGTNSSGGFLPILQSPRRSVLAATKAEGQSDQPRFPEKWIEAMQENPKASVVWLAARAAALVEEVYRGDSLAQTESARLADAVTGKILAPPFGVALAAHDPAPAAKPAGRGLITASDIEIKPRDTRSEWEEQPATNETRALMKEAAAVSNPEKHAAIVLQQQFRFTVEEDRTTERVTFLRVLLGRDEAADQWANWFLPHSPPQVTSRLQVARVVRPDGTSLVFNPAKLIAGADQDSGAAMGCAMVYLPNARAGCVVEIGYRTRELLEPTLPHVSEMIPIQRDAPALDSRIEVRVPEKQAFRVALKNQPSPAEEVVENGRRVFRWELPALAAADALPGDPPAAEWQVWLGISSLPSWDEFADWYRRIAKGSETVDDAVRQTAAELAKGAATRMEKIQRAFEFVSALRYVAIEFGIHGFRPRTPAKVLANRYGDCKDKANLLIALLGSMGIDAKFVLINRGSATDITFPSWQFNHAICFVPKAPEAGQEADLWLDSTDSITPFGTIAPGNFGRSALVFESAEKAEFKKVAGTGRDMSSIVDEWVLSENESGEWSGRFRRRANGLADYALRGTLRALSPAQRRHFLYQQLGGAWPGGDFRDAEISGVSELRESIELHAQVSRPAGDLPRPDFPWLGAFSAPERPRPLLLNDGQPCAGTQTIRLHFARNAPANLPPPVETSVAGEKLSVMWRQIDGRTIERVAKAELLNPLVAAADYAKVRAAVRQWTLKLTNLE